MKKILSLLLSFIMIFSLTACSSAASSTQLNKKTVKENSEEVKSTGDKLKKDETVYVLCDSKGSVDQIIVSDWIQNGTKNKTIKDKTNLTDVSVVKGDATYKINDQNMTIWDSKGGDVYYQGNSNKKLPVNVNISYQLDDKAISYKDIEGKSGKVTIRFDYENTIFETKTINGKQEKIYVPFVMVTGMMLDKKCFSNVKVSNGKTVSMNDNTIVMGFALPGMQETLDVSKNDLDLPDYIEITANVKDFKIGSTMTLAANEMFNELDVSDVDDLKDLKNQMNKLTDAMDKLMDGSSKLYENLALLLNKSNELVSGINKIANGTKSLKIAGGQLYDGSVSLRDGLKELQNGLGTLVSNNETLNNGAKTVFETLLTTANTQLATSGLDQLGVKVEKLTMNNYDKELENILKQLDVDDVYQKAYNLALQKVTNQVKQNEGKIRAEVEKVVQENVKEQVTNAAIKKAVSDQIQTQAENLYKQYVASQVTDEVLIQHIMQQNNINEEQAKAYLKAHPELKEQVVNQKVSQLTNVQKQTILDDALKQALNDNDVITAAKNTIASSEQYQNQINTTVAQQMKSENVQKIIESNIKDQEEKLIAQYMLSEDVQNPIAQAVEGAKSGAGQIAKLKVSLSSYQTFYDGLLTYTAGVQTAYEGSQQLYAGSKTLTIGMKQAKEGLNNLDEAMKELKTKTSALPKGVSQLKNGSMQLSKGLKQLNEEGIEKLVNAVNGDLEGLLDRLEAIIDVSKNYNNFAGINSSMDGSVKFIFKTDGIGE